MRFSLKMVLKQKLEAEIKPNVVILPESSSKLHEYQFKSMFYGSTDFYSHTDICACYSHFSLQANSHTLKAK